MFDRTISFSTEEVKALLRFIEEADHDGWVVDTLEHEDLLDAFNNACEKLKTTKK